MVTKKRIAIAATVTIILALIITAGCRRKTFKNPERIKSVVSWFVDDLLDDINATDDQKLKINAIKDRVVTKIIEKHKQNRKFILESLTLWEGEEVDMNAVHERIESKVEERKKSIHMAAEALKEIHGILNPEQKAIIIKKARERLTD